MASPPIAPVPPSRDMANKTRTLDLLHRYDSRFERQYHRALFQLERQREIRHRELARAGNGNLPNRPEEHLNPAQSAASAESIPTPEPSRPNC